jgi:response regulator of citrate/malate metabolism
MDSDELVFIIDDDLIQNEIHLMLLEKIYPDVLVKTFTSTTEAIRYIEENKEPNIVFLDLHMPGESETVFLKEHQNRHLNSDIYLMSSMPYLEDESIMARYPAIKGFISKPLLEHKIRPVFNHYV